MGATPQQQEVINSQTGTILVNACPGSGKTTTLVNRCKALPANHTKKILMFNASAREDFAKKVGANSMTDVKTFHQFCMHELWGNPEPYGYRRGAKLIKGGPFQQFKDANGLSNGGYEPRSWVEAGWDNSLIEWADSALYTREVVERGIALSQEIFLEKEARPHNPFGSPAILAGKEMELATYKAIFFHREWLKETNQFTFASVVRDMAENKDKLRKAADHVMVDEFQDVDRFQFDIITALARIDGTKSFACVGDPNQMIYGWRGAVNGAFEKMKEEFADAQVLPLTVNFRSHDEILKYADQICPVGMTGVRGSGGEECVSFYENEDGTRPKPEVLPMLLKDSTEYHNHAILCRYNRECAQWQLYLAKRGIPVHLMGRGDYWNSVHIKMAKEAWTNRFGSAEFFAGREWTKFSKQKQFKDEEGEEALAELQAECKFVLELSSEDMKLLGENFDNPRDGLKISTMHRTKGAEFQNVMVFGVNEQLMQDKYLYYVACTRAQNRMVIA